LDIPSYTQAHLQDTRIALSGEAIRRNALRHHLCLSASRTLVL